MWLPIFGSANYVQDAASKFVTQPPRSSANMTNIQDEIKRLTLERVSGELTNGDVISSHLEPLMVDSQTPSAGVLLELLDKYSTES